MDKRIARGWSWCLFDSTVRTLPRLNWAMHRFAVLLLGVWCLPQKVARVSWNSRLSSLSDQNQKMPPRVIVCPTCCMRTTSLPHNQTPRTRLWFESWVCHVPPRRAKEKDNAPRWSRFRPNQRCDSRRLSVDWWGVRVHLYLGRLAANNLDPLASLSCLSSVMPSLAGGSPGRQIAWSGSLANLAGI